MTKEEIYNNYAIEQGYDSWESFIWNQEESDDVIYAYNIVTDLIQEELKKKIAENFGNEEIQQEILNTEIL